MAGMIGRKERADIDPLHIPSQVLPHLFMVNVMRPTDAPLAYQYRLIGTAVTSMADRDLTGEMIVRLCTPLALP